MVGVNNLTCKKCLLFSLIFVILIFNPYVCYMEKTKDRIKAFNINQMCDNADINPSQKNALYMCLRVESFRLITEGTKEALKKEAKIMCKEFCKALDK